jgi:hypothetical protein
MAYAGHHPAPCLVSLSLYASEEEMNSSTAFRPAIFIPFVTAYNLSYTILHVGIELADTDFSTNHF